MNKLERLVKKQKEGVAEGICSVCSSNTFVIDAALLQAKESKTDVLIEATANQVNQMGGYTGMRPGDFRDFVHERAEKTGLEVERIILGGDHLGPVAWKKESSEKAMSLADELVHEFAREGYGKIHLDASMPLGDEVTLSTEEIADRTVRLCIQAEKGFAEYKLSHPDAKAPEYIIGSEVPTPGGSGEEDELSVTKPEDLRGMIECFRHKFEKAGLEDAWRRVVAAVVQPGIEFGNGSVHEYVREEAVQLMETAGKIDGIILEGHSTDYQTEEDLKAMVEDGIGILKVGPALTFAAREGLYALAFMEKELVKAGAVPAVPSNFIEVLDEAMLADSKNWRDHYTDSEPESSFMRKYSYSDRSRYYMNVDFVQESIAKLIYNLDGKIPEILLSQYLPLQYKAVREDRLECKPEALIIDSVRRVMGKYWRACGLEK